ncbi:hypothetical protein C8R45DRAFT_930267 [Mycena sanguinolenta]|nr:hypothetical protein C8R45DRAFT_930265 [Mycena sanguinolenta]KAJ6486630.1 hypothetical protein C8R45DRAFT_930267 [Mycena sanguinolenta]
MLGSHHRPHYMANGATLVAARERKSQRLAESKARSVAVPTESPSSAFTAASLTEQPLHFPDSPTPMALPSDDVDLSRSIPIPPRTSTKRKCASEVVSDNGSDSDTEPVKKTRARRSRAQSDEDIEAPKPPKKKPRPKPKPKAKAAAKSSRAVSLACRTNKVTKTTPPEGNLFSMFHCKTKEATPPGPAEPPAQYNSYYPYSMPPLFPGQPPAFLGYHPYPPAAQQLPSGSAIHPMLSSDPPDDDVSYPSVIDFIATLIHAVPGQEGLRTVGETLDSLHFFQIDEIVSLTVDDLGTVRFGTVVPGDAAYLLDKVRKEVKRLDKLARRSRR